MTVRSFSPSSFVRRLRSGDEPGSGGGWAQWRGADGWSADRKCSGLIDGSASAPVSVEMVPVSGALEPSRAARVRARLTRIRKIHVLSDDLPSNAQIPRITPSQVSCTTSSAMAAFAT
jgi:hypothetical protein